MTYVPKPPQHRGRVLLDRREPFELFLKFGGGLFLLHFHIGRLVIMIDPKRQR